MCLATGSLLKLFSLDAALPRPPLPSGFQSMSVPSASLHTVGASLLCSVSPGQATGPSCRLISRTHVNDVHMAQQWPVKGSKGTGNREERQRFSFSSGREHIYSMLHLLIDGPWSCFCGMAPVPGSSSTAFSSLEWQWLPFFIVMAVSHSCVHTSDSQH